MRENYRIGLPLLYKGVLFFITAISDNKIRISEEMYGNTFIWLEKDNSDLQPLIIE